MSVRLCTLMAHLRRSLAPVPVLPFEREGISADAKEAVAFAVLAVQAIHAEPANVTQVTGASRPAVLGKICLP
jgi:anhydro-N-acetylmuramic acid kinase